MEHNPSPQQEKKNSGENRVNQINRPLYGCKLVDDLTLIEGCSFQPRSLVVF